MGSETNLARSVLTVEEVAFFRENGYVRVKQALPRELALEMQRQIWAEFAADHGIERENRSTWRPPPRSPRRAKHSALNEKLATERFQGAISDCLGYDNWERPASWGGFNVTFPDPEAPAYIPSDTWHWDGSPTSRGLLIFSFYSEVGPGGGGTPIVSGSHRVVESFYASLSPEDLARPHKWHRKALAHWDPWLEALTGNSEIQERNATLMDGTTEVRGVPCRVVELTGEPGDAVFCNLGILHAVAKNRSDHPRFVRVKFLLLER